MATSAATPGQAVQAAGGTPAELVGAQTAGLAATRAAALACQRWVGRGDKNAADEAATEAMRETLGSLHGTGVVVIGEGAKDEAPALYDGERLGTGEGPTLDIAVDPLECTGFCADGLPGSLATIAFAMEGSMESPGPAFYMDKLVVPPAARDTIALGEGAEQNLKRVAEALNKSLEEMRVVVLDKPRHEELIELLRELGARVSTPADGDVVGALGPLLPQGEADMLIGIGGTPEGIMTACAARSLGGGMQGRLAPQKEKEAKAVEEAGLDTERIYEVDDLVRGPAVFIATGVTTGPLLRGPWEVDGATLTESLVISAGSVRRLVETTFEQETAGAARP